MKHLNAALILITLIFLTSCGSQKRVSKTHSPSKSTTNTYTKRTVTKTPIPVEIQRVEQADAVLQDLKNRKPNLNESTLAYIEEYNDIAILEMLAYQIPASITLAQGILESNSGRSRLAVKGNNHFGVKCHSSWEGKRLHHDDDARQECFRKYEHPLSSFRDHSLFLFERNRYTALFELKLSDYKGWARGLKKAGYATDPKYPHKLIDLIETYELYNYDDFGDDFKYGGTVVKKSDETFNKDNYIVVSQGDTLYSIAKNYNLTVDRLKWLNGLKSNELSIGQKLYLR
jgi:flagellum-specific peptidoglycan hydrolase FlgJ